MVLSCVPSAYRTLFVHRAPLLYTLKSAVGKPIRGVNAVHNELPMRKSLKNWQILTAPKRELPHEASKKIPQIFHIEFFVDWFVHIVIRGPGPLSATNPYNLYS